MVQIRKIDRSENENSFQVIKKLFLELHRYMEKNGLVLKLADHGEQKWEELIKWSLGRNSQIFVAEKNNVMVGYAYGVIRIAPEYLGGKKIGYIQHIYVKKRYRRENIGQLLLVHLENWFRDKNTDLIELEVLVKSEPAIEFWKKNNYHPEFLRMTKV